MHIISRENTICLDRVMALGIFKSHSGLSQSPFQHIFGLY